MMASNKLFKIKVAKKGIFLALPLMLSLVACEGDFSNAPSVDPTPNQELTNRGTETNGSDEVKNPTETEKKSSSSESSSPQSSNGQVQIYWLSQEENNFDLVPSQYETSDSEISDGEKLTQSIERLLKGPVNANVSSAIPDGTKLNRVALKEDGIHLDLSKTFIEGGGSQSMQGRLGQVIYTASSLDSNAPVWISVEGEALEVLGGEGLEVSQPMTRKEFDENFSL